MLRKSSVNVHVKACSNKLAVLWNGAWHYKQISRKQSLEQVQTRDKIKLQRIVEAGWTPYVIKDLGKFSSVKVDSEFHALMEYIRVAE